MQVPQSEITIRGADGAVLLQKTVPPGEYLLGREPAAEFCFQADLLSRRHAQLTINYDHALIEDLGSSNGTFVNGKAVTEPTRLWPNQKVQVGAATVELRRVKSLPPPDVSLAPAQAAVQRLLPEELLREKKYDIGGVIAQGGMGAILDAMDSATERTVAMKVMLDGSSPDDLTRFVAEAKVTAQLEHPNIVPVHELSVDENGQPFYTMKMVRGITLKKVLDLLAAGAEATVKKYPLSALLTVYQKLCDAVAFAHSKGILHRDLKPENVMLGDFGEVLVMDWGLAKNLGGTRSGASQTSGIAAEDQGRAGARPSESAAPASTLAGTIMGTPQYMSPEQARGEVEDLDIRSDIYALGAILYHILALRPPVTGRTAMEVVSKVAEGHVEPLCSVGSASRKGALTERTLHLPGGAIPDSLSAVVRKAMAFERDQRYWTVEELQADLTAYQNGFATSAERAGAWKQLLLALKRHKVAAAGVAAVLVVGTTLGAKAIVEGRRAEREAVRANGALADLKKSAPALLQLAESEADSQRFDSALAKIDAALALDPALLRAWWQRAWVLLALERWSEAADALRLARQHDPAGAGIGGKRAVASTAGGTDGAVPSILPAVEKVAAAPEAERWKSDAAREVFAHLQSVEATGPSLALSSKLMLNAKERLKLADKRLLAALGKGNYAITDSIDGAISLDLRGRPLTSLEAVRGLPIDCLNVAKVPTNDLEPLRGMRLRILNLSQTKVVDLTPLRGMPLTEFFIESTQVRDLSPLAGMSLTKLQMNFTRVADLTPLVGMPLIELSFAKTEAASIEALRGMPLVKLDASNTKIVDFSPLKGAPLETLIISATKSSDLAFLQRMPLRTLDLRGTPARNIGVLRGLPLENLNLESTSVNDLSPLQSAPIKDLDIHHCAKLTDYTPVLTLPWLERLHCDVLPAELLPLRESATLQFIEADAYPGEGSQGARPVAEFWRAYDAQHPAEKK